MIPLKDLNPSKRFPILNLILIFVNTLVFFYELSLGSRIVQFFYEFGFVPYKFSLYISGRSVSPYIIPIFTSMFLHGGWAHIIGNMLYLYVFGDNVEDTLGKMGYLLLYFLSGIVAVFAQYVISPLSKIPMIGASGAISGVLGAYLVFFPRARIISLVPDPFTFGLFFRIAPISAFYYLFIWFLLQLMQGVATLPFAGKIGGTAFWAHIGGFVFGVIYAIIYRSFKTYRHK
uniref:Rhomboid family intramembrane serine protease n=1 Tax=candidate division WOR-3 bacterium TaxID=2052148 RepID=A0A7V4E4R0_UNCW3